MRFTHFVFSLTICASISIGRAQDRYSPSSYLTCDTCVGNNHRWCGTVYRGNCVYLGTKCEKGVEVEQNSPINCITDCRRCIREANHWCDFKEPGGFCVLQQYEGRARSICENGKGKWMTSLTECPESLSSSELDGSSSHFNCDTCVKNNHRWCRPGRGSEGKCVSIGTACERGSLQTDQKTSWNCIAECKTCTQADRGWCDERYGLCEIGERDTCVNKKKGKWITSPMKCEGVCSVKYSMLLSIVTLAVFLVVS